MSRITVILVNGNINRLRALVSGIHLAKEHKCEVRFIWPKEHICLNDAHSIFSAEYLKRYFVSEEEVLDLFNFQKLKEGTTILDGDSVIIKGGNKGEQEYLDKLSSIEDRSNRIKNLYIVSGGIFHANTPGKDVDFDTHIKPQRSRIYKEIEFNTEILESVQSIKNKLEVNYISTHLRYKDLMAQSPSSRNVLKTILNLAYKKDIQSIFIASDSENKKNKFKENIINAGLQVVTNPDIEITRGREGSNKAAIIDWILLANSKYLIHFNSSFGIEAAVFNPNLDEIKLRPSRFLILSRMPIQKSYVIFRKVYHLYNRVQAIITKKKEV